jgi:transmembrane sensor
MLRQTAKEIDVEAADWAARVDRGLSPDEHLALEAWVAADVRRPGAYARMRATSLHSERARALAPNFDHAKFQPARPAIVSRRGLLLTGGGLIAAGVAGVAVLKGLDAGSMTYTTKIGEVSVTSLADGSTITLNTATRITVEFTDKARNVALLEGEALFDVAKDATRPFTVRAGNTLARAVGTSFTVRRLADSPIQVLVREGVVDVSRREGAGDPKPVRLAANTLASSPTTRNAQIAASAVPERTVERELAWRGGQIVFEDETLAQAAAQLARYSETRLVIDDPAIGAERITGLFKARDTLGFANAVAASFDLRVETAEGEVRLQR